MRIALMTTDKPGALQVRKDNRDAHLAYIKDTGVVEMAGPFLDADGEMCGSLIVMDVLVVQIRTRRLWLGRACGQGRCWRRMGRRAQLPSSQ